MRFVKAHEYFAIVDALEGSYYSQSVFSPAAWLQANQIASLVLSPGFPDLVDGATHYHANYVSPNWASSLVSVATIGTHKFYR